MLTHEHTNTIDRLINYNTFDDVVTYVTAHYPDYTVTVKDVKPNVWLLIIDDKETNILKRMVFKRT